MSKFIFKILLFSLPFFVSAQETKQDTLAHSQANPTHQLRFSIDANKILLNTIIDNRTSYEASVDYYWHKEIYLLSDFGWGNSSIDYSDLKYKTNNTFLRLGMDKPLFVRKQAQDWGMGFVGFRYALGFVHRDAAQYTTNDGLGGIISGTIPAADFTAHWMELTGGMRIELVKNVFAGWNVRVKFLLNPTSFGELKPAYITGFGSGDKNTAFDYNVYIGYALRWSSKK
ncbi:MAG: DUF6048 family protein [Phycisphaerales bacterium]|nr:DUF6048 family protein [Phycisphaerales bacterium]